MGIEHRENQLAMLKEDWEKFVEIHGRVPTWPPILRHKIDPEQERDRNA